MKRKRPKEHCPMCIESQATLHLLGQLQWPLHCVLCIAYKTATGCRLDCYIILLNVVQFSRSLVVWVLSCVSLIWWLSSTDACVCISRALTLTSKNVYYNNIMISQVLKKVMIPLECRWSLRVLICTAWYLISIWFHT